MPEEKDMQEVSDKKSNKQDYHERLETLVEENIKLSKKVLKLTEKNNSILKWQRFWGFLKLLIIIIPLVLGVIYLPPLLEKIFEFYQDLLGLNDSVKSITPSLDSVTPEFIKNLKK